MVLTLRIQIDREELLRLADRGQVRAVAVRLLGSVVNRPSRVRVRVDGRQDATAALSDLGVDGARRRGQRCRPKGGVGYRRGGSRRCQRRGLGTRRGRRGRIRVALIRRHRQAVATERNEQAERRGERDRRGHAPDDYRALSSRAGGRRCRHRFDDAWFASERQGRPDRRRRQLGHFTLGRPVFAEASLRGGLLVN